MSEAVTSASEPRQPVPSPRIGPSFVTAPAPAAYEGVLQQAEAHADVAMASLTAHAETIASLPPVMVRMAQVALRHRLSTVGVL